MTHAFLDRLLFALPGPSRATLLRGGLYLLFGLALYALFLGGLYAVERAENTVRRQCESIPGVAASMSRPHISLFPPSLSVERLRVSPRDAAGALQLRNVRATAGFFPFRISVEADVAGGKMHAALRPSSLVHPERVDGDVVWEGIHAEALLSPFLSSDGTARLKGGTLNGAATLSLPLPKGSPAPWQSEGSLNLNLRRGVLEVNFPMLKTPRMENVDGNLDLSWKKERLSVNRFELRNPAMSCTAQGDISLVPRDPAASRMSLRSTLRIPPEQLRQELLPERTRDAFRRRGEVRLQLGDSFRRPSINVQP